MVMLRTLLLAIFIVATLAVSCPTGAQLIPNCATCNNNNNVIVCQKCLNGFYLVSQTCVACSSTLPNCLFCELNSANRPDCSLCINNFGLLNNQCRNCSSIVGCQSCSLNTNNLQCTACNPGLVLYNAQTQCVPCQILNCASCRANSDLTFTCTACASRFYLQANSCLSCASNITYCASCLFDQNRRLICSSCDSPLLFLENNICAVNCTRAGLTLCARCSLVSLSSNTTVCLSCIGGYYLNRQANICQECFKLQEGCMNCSAVGNGQSIVCSACAPGYYLSVNPSICILCSVVRTNCATCNFDFATNRGQCASCVSGFYLNATDSICYSCTFSPFASAAFPPNSCETCTHNNNNSSGLVCLKCMSQYYVSLSSCVLCSSRMQQCLTCQLTIAFSCLSCFTGFILNELGQCRPCSQRYSNCVACNQFQCTDCEQGYYSTDNKQCKSDCLVPNCQTCLALDNSKCQQCLTAFLLSPQRTCSVPQCLAPRSFNGMQCTCPFLSYFSNNQCLSCSNNCITCSNGICIKCLPGYYLSADTCLPCTSNCQLCDSIVCHYCQDGYSSNGAQCSLTGHTVVEQVGLQLYIGQFRLCGMGCRSCQLNRCLSCNYGFYLAENSCRRCVSNCKMCSNTSQSAEGANNRSRLVCHQCFSGYALVQANGSVSQSSCLKCRQPVCMRCDYNVHFCLLCAVAFAPNSQGNCLPCASNCDFCDQQGPGTCDVDSCSLGYTQINQTTCVRCMNGCSSCQNKPPYDCIGCTLGTFLAQAQTKTCLDCPIGCAVCSSARNCLQCRQFYYLSGASCLPDCDLPCLACSLANNTKLCSRCLLGYVLVSDRCQPDFSCTALTSCQVCALNYFAYQGRCHQCQTHCQSCIIVPPDPGYQINGSANYKQYLTCSLCSNGFYLGVSNQCLNCASNCLLCLSSTHCYKCKQGHFLQTKLLNSNGDTYNVGQCLRCLSYCLSCYQLPQNCISCHQGYYLKNYICYSLTNVSLVLTLISSSDSLYQNVMEKYPQLFVSIVKLLGRHIVANPYLLTIESIRNGSVVVTANAGIDPSEQPLPIYNQITNTLQQTTTLSGFTLGQSSATALGFTPQTAPPQSTSNNFYIYIIIGGAVLALLVLVVVIIVCVRRRRAIKYQNQSGDSKKGKEDMVDPATSKNMLKNEEGNPKSSVRGFRETQYKGGYLRKGEGRSRVSKEGKHNKQQLSHISQQHSVHTRPAKPRMSNQTYNYGPNDQERMRSDRQHQNGLGRPIIAHSKTSKIYPKSSRQLDMVEQRREIVDRYRSQRQIEEQPYEQYNRRVHRFEPVSGQPVRGAMLKNQSNFSSKTKPKSKQKGKFEPDAHTQYI